MQKATAELVKAAIIGFGIPAVLLALAVIMLLPREQNEQEKEEILQAQPTVSTQTLPEMSITVLIDGQPIEMDLEVYVARVVLAEMPASFESEALKAQAVASRTFALRTCADGQKHNGSVCDSYRCCQAYMTEAAYLERGWDPDNVSRVQEAVRATAGQVLTYDGEWIRSTYFACSGGFTEAAVDVWGKDYPYLQSVKSPGEEETVYYTDTVEFTHESFQEALGVSLPGSAETWFGTITYTGSGGVQTMEIGGTTYRGTTLRSLLGLRSTIFEVIVSQERIVFLTHGYGHRVGMSQYGAEAMALEGYDYKAILAYYYRDTLLVENYQMSH